MKTDGGRHYFRFRCFDVKLSGRERLLSMKIVSFVGTVLKLHANIFRPIVNHRKMIIFNDVNVVKIL